MLFFSTVVALSSLGALVYAQSSNVTVPLEIAAIEAHFQNSGLAPSLLSAFSPSAIMTVNFTGHGTITPGENLTKSGEQRAPAFPSQT
jgi:phosphatidylethanolamine-binding protein